jgi:paraquat-inducible protein B
MTDVNSDVNHVEDIPEAIVVKRKSLSIVWLIPLVALFVGGWLAYQALRDEGPTITIGFKTAEGIEADATKIKFKNVDVGHVERVAFSEDLTQVIVTAKLSKNMRKYLTDSTRFWVVRARIAAGRVSGLGTLISGTHIGMDPGFEGASRRAFIGLESPPAITTGASGRFFDLIADSLGSLEIGSPVYYRQLQVGQVVQYFMSEDGNSVQVKIFIDSPHDRQVFPRTRFWNVSGIEARLDASGIRISTGSLMSLLVGGIAFETPLDLLHPETPAEEGRQFILHKDYDSIYEKVYATKITYLLYFNETVRGLLPGAPVEFRGIEIGQVKDIKMEFDPEKQDLRIPVLIEVEPERIEMKGVTIEESHRSINQLIEKGLRAQLRTGMLLTGQLFVHLDIYPEAPKQRLTYEKEYPVIPTIPATLEELTSSLTQLLHKMENFPIEQIGKDLEGTMKGFNELSNSKDLRRAIEHLDMTIGQAQLLITDINKTIAPQLKKAIDQVNQTLSTADELLNPDSPISHELRQTLREFTYMARSVRSMVEYLERHPETLIHGKKQVK